MVIDHVLRSPVWAGGRHSNFFRRRQAVFPETVRQGLEILVVVRVRHAARPVLPALADRLLFDMVSPDPGQGVLFPLRR